MVDHIDEGSMRNDYRELASDSKRTAEAMAHTYKDHPSGAHFAKAARHYDRALQAVDHGDDDEIVKHHDRGYNTFAKAEKMIKEEDDEIDLEEGRKATPLKGHPYHEKSDDELHYIIKDAGEAARAGRGLSSEGKYLDQVNDAATVLYHRRNGGKQIVKPKNEETELDEVSKATLDRYRQKAKQRFRAKGGINAALDKQDKKSQSSSPRKRANEDIEPLDELSPKTLKSYVKKAGSYTGRSSWGLAKKGEKEEDKSMSTDGYKYPEKQARHQKAASKLYHKSNNRDKGMELANKKLRKEDEMPHLVDLVMVDEEQPNASAYIEGIELRCNSIVDEIKENIRKTLFNLNAEIEEGRGSKTWGKSYLDPHDPRGKPKPKPGSPGGSWVEPAVADRFKKEAKEKKQFASAKREIDKLKKKELKKEDVELDEAMFRPSLHGTNNQAENDDQKYKVIRFHKNGGSKTLGKNLTLSQARSHCAHPETSSSTCKERSGKTYTKNHGEWFDGYDRHK